MWEEEGKVDRDNDEESPGIMREMEEGCSLGQTLKKQKMS